MNRWLLRYAVVLGFVGVLALALVGNEPVEGALERALGSEPTPTTTTTDAPPMFPPIAEPASVPAVRTGTNLVLPVTGGEAGSWQVLTPCAATAVATGEPVTGAHIVIDPGHGGTETGAIGPTGLTEAEVNLDIANRAARILADRGASVVLTRSSDVRVTLQSRAALATALRPLAFVSIHHNAVPRGTSDQPAPELYHHLADPESKRLAGLMWEEYQQAFTPFAPVWAAGDQPGARARQSVTSGDDFYGVLRRSQGVPGVLSEAAFISEPAEEALLRTEEFRQAEAQAIADAVVRFVTTDEPGSGFVPTKVAETPAGGGGGTAGCEDPPLS